MRVSRVDLKTWKIVPLSHLIITSIFKDYYLSAYRLPIIHFLEVVVRQ